MHLALIIGAVVVAGVIVDRVLLLLEQHGLIYYRRIRVRGAAGAALATLQEIVQPHAAEIVATAREQEEREDDDDDGDKRKRGAPHERGASSRQLKGGSNEEG